MTISSCLGAAALTVFVMSAGQAAAAAVTYSDRAAFDAAVSGATTVDFEGLAGSDYVLYGETLAVGDAAFTESSRLYPAPEAPIGNLFVFDPAYAAGFYGTAGLTSAFLNQNTGDGAPVVVSFASRVTAVGVDLGTLSAGAGPVQITLGSGESFVFAAPEVGFSSSALSFFGVVSETGFSSISFYDPGQHLALDDLSYAASAGTPAADVPAPAAAPLLLLGLGGLVALRRRRG
ncbi:PEP-CTERM sorting domain-containing protein [Rhodovulum sp. DZ06]|uniref:PEP-CTERM sorting domain-containing protein n=1 Tax=Rhodovulum sp. DZ06 TaxID=3425126 RepID=UPI003D32F841